MSEFWVSEGRHWCKFCKKWISSNKIQIRQHEAGERHIQAEEKFFRDVSSKVPPERTTIGSTAASSLQSGFSAVDTGLLLERITQSQFALNQQRSSEQQPAQPQEAQVEETYPLPADEALGHWVEVKTTEQEPVGSKAVKEETAPVRRIGAADEADEEEARARDLDAEAKPGEDSNAGTAVDAVFRKRGISKSRKRKKRVAM